MTALWLLSNCDKQILLLPCMVDIGEVRGKVSCNSHCEAAGDENGQGQKGA